MSNPDDRTAGHDRPHDPHGQARRGPGVGAALLAFALFVAIAAGSYMVAQRRGGLESGAAGEGHAGGGRDDHRAGDAMPEASVDEQPRVEGIAFLGGSHHVVRSQEFQGADMVAILGESELDLTGADLAATGGRIEAFVLFGKMHIRVPRDWTVVRDGHVVFGKFVHSLETDRADPAKKVRLEAVVVMGEIEVTH